MNIIFQIEKQKFVMKVFITAEHRALPSRLLELDFKEIGKAFQTFLSHLLNLFSDENVLFFWALQPCPASRLSMDHHLKEPVLLPRVTATTQQESTAATF